MSNEITEENFEILFDEEINVVEIRYQGVNAALLIELQNHMTALQAQLDAALDGVSGSLGSLENDLDSLSTLIQEVGHDLEDEALARFNADDLISSEGNATAAELGDAITAETDARGAAIIAEAEARNAAIAEANAIIVTDVAALAISVSGLAVDMGAAQASIIEVSTGLATETSARAAQYSALQADFGDTNAAVLEESVARADGDDALASQITVIEAEVALKNKTYYQTTAPSSGMIAGDLWFDTDDSNRAYRYDGATWVDVTPAGSGNTTYYQTTAPSSGMVSGDIWFDSDDNNKQYRYSGSSWVAVDDGRIATNAAAISSEATARASADTALASSITTVTATVNTKNKTYRQTSAPSSGMDTGDTWYDSDDGDKPYRYNGSSWVVVQDGSISTVAASVTTEASARVAADGAINAKYGVTIDVNGRITGYELIGGGGGSEFNILVDKFNIYNGTTDIQPFSVSGGVVTMTDVAVIGSLTITNTVQTFTPTWTGFTTAPTGDFSYIDLGALVILWSPGSRSAFATSLGMTITNLPTAIRPSGQRYVNCIVENQGLFSSGVVQVTAGGGLFFSLYSVSSGLQDLASSGTKGVPSGFLIIYSK